MPLQAPNKRHIDNEAFEASLVENEQQPPQLILTQRAVAVYQLRTGIQVRPNPYAVEAKASNEMQIVDDIGSAHRAEVRDERQKLGRSVDGEAIALNGQLLRLRLDRTETQDNEHTETACETPEGASTPFTCHDYGPTDPP